MDQNNGNMFEAGYVIRLQQIKEHSTAILILGILYALLGTLAVIFAFTSTLVSVVYLGSLLIVVGVIEGIKSFTVKNWSTFFLHLALSILFIVGGLSIVFYPTINAITLTLIFAIFLMVSGILKMVFAAIKRLPHRFWIFINGALGLLLGILILKQWPTSGLWVLGMFIGIDMIFSGWTWIVLALKAKNEKGGNGSYTGPNRK